MVTVAKQDMLIEDNERAPPVCGLSEVCACLYEEPNPSSRGILATQEQPDLQQPTIRRDSYIHRHDGIDVGISSHCPGICASISNCISPRSITWL